MINIGADQQESIQYSIEHLPVALHFQRFEKTRGDELPLHWHPEWQVTWISDGELCFLINEEELILDTNHLLILPAKVFHQAKPITNRVRAICFNFLLDFLTEEIVSAYLLSVEFASLTLKVSEEQRHLLQQFQRTETINPLFVLSFITQVLGRVSVSDQQSPSHREDQDLSLFSEMLQFLQANYAHTMTVADLAASGHISKSKCTTLFKRYTTLSPIAYLNEYRLQEARRMLQERNLSITEVSHRVGFNQLSYFVSCFKRKYEKTPLQYQKSYLH
ncbi:putative HTH-type transcriptional regulator YdeC [Enterococcus florum]|uniref:Putative HTH-type transcriptional regulator YdeC n=1 Tax=Enterococcus florum TaxID=2480627 RepID=A0A4V0WPT2_9ENTE|nr:AraC family transcriptional regulator [Enterococcus florum]GCF94949.1 putative HTH-type transcriptional regulator YdeC [Enterococcus florum]